MKPAHFSVAQGAVEGYNRLFHEMTKYHCTDEVRCIGYPRFYRAKELQESIETPLLSKEAKKIFRIYKDYFKILYAPTRRSELFSKNLFDWPKIEKTLVEKNAFIFIRKHVSANPDLDFSAMPSSERIVILPSAASAGSLDLVASVDCLLTDISSIMMEALALNIPIIHALPKKAELMYEDAIALPGHVCCETGELVDYLIHGGMSSNPYMSQIFHLNTGPDISKSYSKIINPI
jgi:CDP-glycerol glycerophosphotransferase (TagB/SpsB family)